MLRWPSQATALANGFKSVLKACCAAQIAQISTDRFFKSVLMFAQVKAVKYMFSTDSTDIYGLTSRVENRGVFPGRLSPGARCGPYMGKSVLSVLTLPAANSETRPAVAGAWRGADRRR
ncbi:hypothetical protein PBI_EMERSON_72 [Mycobacterium phage Emerson]|nr:hypothetical protein PBI_EMERSON_72 [Mycobacterium phage Emerson]UVF60660.1 hypothetical protein SEA_PADPAT_73 [Mycobacterium phage Padpat]